MHGKLLGHYGFEKGGRLPVRSAQPSEIPAGMRFFRGPQAENFTQLEPRLDKSGDNNPAAPLCDTQASTP